MRGGDCGERVEEKGLWRKGPSEGTEGKWTRGGDCWERVEGWGKGLEMGTV